MPIIRDYKVNALPAIGEPNSRYYVLNTDNTVDEYITDLNGNFKKVGSTAAMKIGANTVTKTVDVVLFSNSNNVSFGITGSTITASVNAGAVSTLFFGNQNGISFNTLGSTVTASYTVPNDYVSTAQSSLFQQTSQMSDYLDSGYTSHTHPQYINTSQSSVFLTTQTVQTQGAFTFSAGTQSTVPGTLILSNSNGMTFGMDSGTITGSYTVPTNYISSNQSSLFQHTSGMSDYLGTGYTTHTHPQYQNTSQSSLFRQTSADSQLQFTSQMSDYLDTTYTSHSHSDYINTSDGSLYQLVANSSDSLGTTYTTHTHSQYINTSFASVFQQTSLMSDYQLVANSTNSLGTGYTTHTHSQYLNTSQSSLFRHTSADSQLQFTSQMSDYLGTGYTTHTHSQYLNTSQSSLFQHTSATSAITASAVNTSQSSLFEQTSHTTIFLTTQSGQAFSATNASSAFQTLVFTNANGVTFSNNAGSVQVTHALQFTSNTSAITASALNTSQSSLFQHTSATSAITSAALHTSASRVINIVANTNSTAGGTASLSSNVSFSAANGVTFYTSAGGAIVANFNSANYQQTSATSAITSNALNTSQSSLFQHTSATSAITSAAVHTSSPRIQGIIGSNTTYVTGSVSLRDLNGITWQSTTGQAFQITHDLQYTSNTSAITSNAVNTSVTSNYQLIANSTLSLGTGATASFRFTSQNSQLVFSSAALNLTNISATLGSNAISLSVAAAGGAQTAISGLVVSDTTYTSGTASFRDGNGISFASGTGQGISITHGLQFSSNMSNYQTTGAYLTTADLSQNSSNYFRNWKLTGNTSGTTSSAQGTELWLQGGNGVTISGSSNSIVLSVATNYQSQGAYLTTAALSQDSSKYAGTGVTTAGGAGFSGTLNTAGLSISIPTWLTTAMASNRGSDFVQAAAVFNGTNISGTIASNAISLSVAAPGAALVNFSAGTTSGNVGSIVFSNSNGVSFGMNGSTITASAAGGAGGGIALSASNSAFTSGTVSLQGSGAITIGTAAQQINLSVPGTSSIVGTGQVSVFVNGSTISIGAPINYISSFENMPGIYNSSQFLLGGASASLAVAFLPPQNISVSYIRIPVLMSMNGTTIATLASATATASAGLYSTWNAVVYSLGTGASSRSLMSVTSGSNAWTFSNQFSMTNSTQGSYTQGYTANVEGNSTTLTTQYSISNTNYSFSTNAFAAFSSNRMLDINFAGSLSSGNYWLIFGYTSSSASGGPAGLSAITGCNVKYLGNYGASHALLAFGILGSTNMTSGGVMGAGSYSKAGGGTTSALDMSNISSLASQFKPYFQMLRSA